jgi:1-acyl-sn-glycerol-3-phosphate acyltransferase
LPQGRSARRLVQSAALALLGFAATAIPLHLFLRRELRDAPDDVRSQGWPIRLLQVLFARYINQWIDVEGLENLPRGSYLVAANHGYKSGVDGFLLGHLFATRARRVPRIVMTAEHRRLRVRAERWVLHHYGIAFLVRDQSAGHAAMRKGMSDTIAEYLKESDHHAVLIFPAGRASADPSLQLKDWSTGAVVAAHKSDCPLVPVAIGGLPPDWTPENVIYAAIETDGPEPPFQVYVRIGPPIRPSGEPHLDLERLRGAVAKLMEGVPGLRVTPRAPDPES